MKISMIGRVMAVFVGTGLVVGSVQAVPAVSRTVPTPTYNGGTANVRTATVRDASVTIIDISKGDVGLEQAARMVEGYFNGLTTMQAEFSQSVTGQAFASEGTFYLKKPRQFLWQYDTPVKQKIISTGTAVYYKDEERNQVTQLPMNSGLARIFNAKKLNLAAEGLRVTGVQSTPRVLVVSLALDKRSFAEDQAGLRSVRMTFDRLPGNALQVREMEAVDTLQVTTKVSFSNVRTGVYFPPKLFDFTPGVYEQRN